MSFDICSCSWFYRIMFHLYLLISNVKFTLYCISNGLPFSTDNWQFHQTQFYKVWKKNCLVQYLSNKHKVDYAEKYILPQTFAGIDYQLNCIGLTLGTLSPFFVLSTFLCYQIISWFQAFVFLAYNVYYIYIYIYIYFIFNTNQSLILLM